MRILIVSVEELKKDEIYLDEKGFSFKKAFNNLGHETYSYFFRKKGFLRYLEKRSLTRKLWLSYINMGLIKTVKEKKPDVTLLLKADTIEAETILAIKKYGTLVINVFPDNPLYMLRYDAIISCDLFFSKDSYVVDTVRKSGYKNIHFLPQCTDPDVHRPIKTDDEKLKSKISLIGSMYQYRHELIKNLAEFEIKIWGKGWEKASKELKRFHQGGDIRGTKKAVVISNSLISLNPHHPLNDIHGVNRRTYDIAACKGFQIADYKVDMIKSYKLDEEIVCFNEMTDLKDKIRYYLIHDKEREEISENAYKKTLEKHTYLHRAKEILYHIETYR